MFKKINKTESAALNNNNNSVNKKVPSLISSGLHILGNLVGDGAIDIDGSVEGNVKSEQVTIRSNGKISGDIVAQVAHIYGEVRGLIRAHAVHIYSSARIEGIIMHQSLTVEDGAFVDAKLKRSNNEKKSFEIEFSGEEEQNSEGIIESAPSFVSTPTLRLIG